MLFIIFIKFIHIYNILFVVLIKITCFTVEYFVFPQILVLDSGATNEGDGQFESSICIKRSREWELFTSKGHEVTVFTSFLVSNAVIAPPTAGEGGGAMTHERQRTFLISYEGFYIANYNL